MNEKLVGSVKSKTMIGNSVGIAGLLALWNDPMLAMLPEKAKYIILGVMAANMLLRWFTDKSLADKGTSEPKPQLVKAVAALVQQEVLGGLTVKDKEAVQMNVRQYVDDSVLPFVKGRVDTLLDIAFKRIDDRMRKLSPPTIVNNQTTKEPVEDTTDYEEVK